MEEQGCPGVRVPGAWGARVLCRRRHLLPASNPTCAPQTWVLIFSLQVCDLYGQLASWDTAVL